MQMSKAADFDKTENFFVAKVELKRVLNFIA